MTPRVLLVSVPAPAVKQTKEEREFWYWHYALKARLTYPNLSTEQLMKLGENENQNVGLLSLASTLLANGIEVVYLAPSLVFVGGHRLSHFEQLLQKTILTSSYDFIGFSAHTCAIPLAKQYAILAKSWSPETKTIIGGPHATGSTGQEFEELLNAFDFVVRGKGEDPFLQLMQGKNSVPGVSFQRRDIRFETSPWFVSPERYPSPANHLMNIKELPAARVFTSLGCRKGKKCVFCADGMHTKEIVIRPIEDVIAEMDWLYRHLGTRYFYLGDENLFLDETHIQAVFEGLKRLPNDIVIGCQARIENAESRLIRDLAQTGKCTEIQYGVESADQAILDFNCKGLRLSQVREVCQMTKSFGINVHCYFLVGLPGETRKTAQLTIKMMEEMLREGIADFIEYRSAIPFPGAPMWEEAERYGVHIRHKRWDEYRGENVPPFDLDGLSAQEIHRYYLEGLGRITLRYKDRYQRDFGDAPPDVNVLSAVTEGSF